MDLGGKGEGREEGGEREGEGGERKRKRGGRKGFEFKVPSLFHFEFLLKMSCGSFDSSCSLSPRFFFFFFYVSFFLACFSFDIFHYL